MEDNKKKIRYICYYNRDGLYNKRQSFPAAETKIDYVVSALVECGYQVELISLSMVTAPNFLFSKRQKHIIDNNISLLYFCSFGCCKSLFLRTLSRILTFIDFIIWFFRNVQRGEQIFVYHSLGYSALLYWLFRLKHCVVVGEIEEIYQDVQKFSSYKARSEYRFINSCDKYIFPTQLLNEKLNPQKKPFIIIHGTYLINEQIVDKFQDGKIHVVYAGTFDIRKGGAAAAAAAAEFLPSNYHIHVCGFGSQQEIEYITQLVSRISSISKAEISYEGLKRGQEYTQFIQRCHIGLSTQDPSAAFNSTSFPSKILSYMSNGLQVVSIQINAIESSAVGKYLYYYTEQTPQQIANAIREVHLNNKMDPRAVLSSLHKEVVRDMQSLLQ